MDEMILVQYILRCPLYLSSIVVVFSSHNIDKFLIRKSIAAQGSSSSSHIQENCAKKIQINLYNLPSSPGLKEKISTYHPFFFGL